MPPSPCPSCGNASEYDRSNPDRCYCSHCDLVFDPVPVFEETRQPYRDDD